MNLQGQFGPLDERFLRMGTGRVLGTRNLLTELLLPPLVMAATVAAKMTRNNITAIHFSMRFLEQCSRKLRRRPDNALYKPVSASAGAPRPSKESNRTPSSPLGLVFHGFGVVASRYDGGGACPTNDSNNGEFSLLLGSVTLIFGLEPLFAASVSIYISCGSVCACERLLKYPFVGLDNGSEFVERKEAVSESL
jgi:hypothetical protein